MVVANMDGDIEEQKTRVDKVSKPPKQKPKSSQQHASKTRMQVRESRSNTRSATLSADEQEIKLGTYEWYARRLSTDFQQMIELMLLLRIHWLVMQSIASVLDLAMTLPLALLAHLPMRLDGCFEKEIKRWLRDDGVTSHGHRGRSRSASPEKPRSMVSEDLIGKPYDRLDGLLVNHTQDVLVFADLGRISRCPIKRDFPSNLEACRYSFKSGLRTEM